MGRRQQWDDDWPVLGGSFEDRLRELADSLDELHSVLLEELGPVLRPMYRLMTWVSRLFLVKEA